MTFWWRSPTEVDYTQPPARPSPSKRDHLKAVGLGVLLGLILVAAMALTAAAAGTRHHLAVEAALVLAMATVGYRSHLATVRLLDGRPLRSLPPRERFRIVFPWTFLVALISYVAVAPDREFLLYGLFAVSALHAVIYVCVLAWCRIKDGNQPSRSRRSPRPLSTEAARRAADRRAQLAGMPTRASSSLVEDEWRSREQSATP